MVGTALRLALLALVAAMAGCAIVPYTAHVPPLTASLAPASKALIDYSGNAGISVQLERTMAFCGVVKQQMNAEIMARKRRQAIFRGVGAGISSGCAAAATAYTSLVAAPDRRISASLSACAGGVLLAAIPSWGVDSQVAVLEAKLSTIRANEVSALGAKAALERQLQAGAGTSTPSLAETLGTSLIVLGNSCQ